MHHSMMRWVVLAFVLLVCMPQAAQADSFDDVFYDGLIFKSKRQTKQAIECFRRAQKLRPSVPEPYALEAMLQVRQGKFKEGERLARKVVTLDREYEQGWQYLANAVMFQNRLEEGISLCKKCLALNPQNDWCLRYMRIAQRKLRLPITDIYEGKFSEDRSAMMQISKDLQEQKYDDALKIINKHIEKYPTHSSGYLKRAYIYEGMHRRDLAMKDYDKVISMYPCDAEAIDLRSQAFQAKKQAGKSLKDLIKLVREDPDHWSTRFRLAYAYVDAGNYRAAKSEYTGLLKVYPDSIEGLSGRGEAHFRAGEYKEAIADFSQAIKLHPTRSASVHYKRGLAYQKMGDKKKAEAEITLSRKMGYDPKDF